MSRLRKKLACLRGDTMVEALAAILIAALGAAALATMVMASTSVSLTSKQALEETYRAESAMAKTAPTSVSIKLGEVTKDIDADAYVSYDAQGNVVFERYENAGTRPPEETP